MHPQLQPGDRMARSDLHAHFGGRLQGRIRPSKTAPVILLITTPGAHESQHDGWTGHHFHFQGEGQGEREQRITNGNRVVAEQAASGRSLLLFVAASDGLVRYLGAYRVDPDIPYVRVSLPIVGDAVQPPRTGYVFRLVPEAGTPVPQGVPAAPPIASSTVIREQDLALPFHPRPGTERGRKATSIEEEAERLLKDYCDHLRYLGHEVRRYYVTPARELLPLPVDLFNRTTNELVACSGSTARTHMLTAFGELLDMRRFFAPSPQLVMLVPSKPRHDLADLCAAYDVTLVWPDGRDQFLSLEPTSTV
ncbi:hypothetical protein [Streptomyces sp. NPDC047525]|uniref:hypothetical protein n=1 Tax=Streptomyces sp. NPDC047525 TaxID=3155264 RepID=UPI0033D0D21A